MEPKTQQVPGLHSNASSKNSLIAKLAGLAIAAAVFIAGASAILFLSFRGSEVKVPSLVGKSEAEANKLLSSSGLRLKIRNRATDEKTPANLVSEQIPAAGTTVKAGQAVGVTISTGIEAKKPEEANLVKPVVAAKPKPSPSPSPKSDAVNGETTDKPAENAGTEAPKAPVGEKAEEGAAKSEPSKSNADKPAADQADGEKTPRPAASRPAVKKPAASPKVEGKAATPVKPGIN